MARTKLCTWTFSVGLLTGCASASSPGSSAVVSPIPTNHQALTVDDALTWPLEGEAGADRLIAALRQVIPVRELQNPGQFSGRGPVDLADGHNLTFASFTPVHHIITVGVSPTPCYPTDRAVALTGATASPVMRDEHGVDIGQSFTVVRSGIGVNFTTTPSPYSCIDAINVSKEASQ